MTSIKALLLFSIVFLFISTSVSAETLQELFARANLAQQQKSFREALIHLKNAAKQDPENVLVHLKLANLFVFTGQGVQAEVEINKANRLGAKPVDTVVLMAKARLLQGKFDELTENVDLLDLPQQDIARLRAIQGHAYYEQRKFFQAKQMFQRAFQLSPNELEVELGQAKLFRIDGKSDQEALKIQSLLARFPDNADVLIVAGDYYRNTGEFDRALELFKKAGKTQQSNVNVWFGVVRSYIGQGNFKDAKAEIQKVLVNYPEHQVANYLLAVIAFEEADFNRAKSAIEIVLKGDKRKFEALKLLSLIQFQQQEYSESEKNLKKFLHYHPDDSEALKTLAALYLKRNQDTLALEILNGLEKLDDAYIYSMIAAAYLHLGNTEKSEFYIKKSILSAPENEAAVIQRYIQRSKLEAGQSLDIEFTDSDYNNFISEGHIPILNLIRKKKYDEAIRIIHGYMKTMPGNALLHYLLGSTYLDQNNTALAEKEFQRSIEINPGLIESHIYLAKLFQLSGKDRDAEREYRAVLRLQENNDQAMVALAGIYHRAGNDEEMLQWLNKSRKMNTASLASREVLEEHYRKKGEKKKALELSDEMVKIQPQNIDLLRMHAINQKAIGRTDLAIETFNRIVALKPQSAASWFGLGQLQYLNNSFDKAKVSFEEVLKLDPENLTAKVILIQIDLKSNQLDQAMIKASNLQRQHPDSPAGFDMLGDVYIALNKPDKAIGQYQQSIKLKKSSETYLKLHSAYNRNNQVKKGLVLLNQWVDQNPDDYQLKEALAITHQRNGNFKKARELYEEIVKKMRNNDRVLRNLALVSLELESPMSIEYAEMAFNLNPENIENKDTLGWVLLKNKNHAKAVKLLKEAAEKSPGDPDIRYHYAVALAQLGENGLAKNQLYLAITVKGYFANRQSAQELLERLKNE